MFNVRKFENADQFKLVNEKTVLKFEAPEKDGLTHARFEIKTVGPCPVRIEYLANPGDKKPTVTLLCVTEGNEVLEVALRTPAIDVSFEPFGECWVRQEKQFAVYDNPNPDEKFTRMEHMGVEMDEMEQMLHRQDLLFRIQRNRENVQADGRTRQLERQVAEAAEAIAAMKKQLEKPAEGSEAKAETGKPETVKVPEPVK